MRGIIKPVASIQIGDEMDTRARKMNHQARLSNGCARWAKALSAAVTPR
jgi:hypothetical protein